MTFIELGKTPISSASPTGEDVRLDPLFEALQAEVDTKPSAGSSGTDWNKVTSTAGAILEGKSKDILVASYLAVGLLHTEKIDGLVTGVTVMRDMADLFWDNLFPPVRRMRGRVQALNWWLEKTLDKVQKLEIDPMPAESLEALTGAVDSLYDILSEKCPDGPSLRQLLDFVRTIPATTVEEPEPEAASAPPSPDVGLAAAVPPRAPQQSPSVSPPAATSPSPGSFSLTALASTAEADALWSAVLEKHSLLVDFMLSNSTSDPLWYRLNLLSAWFGVKGLPPATDGKTLIPRPDEQIGRTLGNLTAASNWPGVVKTSSYTIRRYLFWLDMNRQTSEALSRMGQEFAAAREAVEHETVLFVRRFSGIQNFTFSDGTPFADDTTKAWLQDILPGGGEEQPASIVADDLAQKVAAEFSRCQELIKGGKQGEGLTSIQERLRGSTSGRERCMWRLALVRLLALSGMEKLAVPHITELMKDYDSYRLEEWDPEMALHTLKAVWKALQTQTDPEQKRKADEILARISMISPSEAFNLIKT